MAEIKPFRAWRYNVNLELDINDLVAPLFDVVSKKQLNKLYHNSYNSIHLSVPTGTNPSLQAKETLNQWIEKKILVQDDKPRIYPYYQYFNVHSEKKTYCRKGFICMIKASFWDEKIVMRHENTIPNAVSDRIELLKETQINSSPTHGLYQDNDFVLEKYMDKAIASPVYETEDYQGVKDVLGVIEEEEIIQKFISLLENRQIVLADGHHRYESSIAYRKEMMENTQNYTGNEAYNFHMMYLTNSASNHLKILPTHRLISNLIIEDIDKIIEKASKYFHIKEVDNPSDLPEIIVGKKWAFGLLHKDKTLKIRLKEDAFNELSWQFPELIKKMDLTVLHFFFIEKVLGISGKSQRSSNAIHYERNFAECFRKVATSEVEMALITNEISIQEINKICFSGHIMPPKSTYFYPKAICGFLFGSINSK